MPNGFQVSRAKSEENGDVAGYPGDQAEDRQFVRLEFELILEQEADRQADEAASGGPKAQQQKQDAQIEQDPHARGGRQHRRREFRGRHGVRGHRRRSPWNIFTRLISACANSIGATRTR
jgi:hypothetical protein